MVAGIHCRGEDLAFFPPRLFFSATFVYICSENAAHIGGFYLILQSSGSSSCGLLLKKKKRNLHTKWHSNVLIYANDKRRGIDFAFADINSF